MTQSPTRRRFLAGVAATAAATGSAAAGAGADPIDAEPTDRAPDDEPRGALQDGGDTDLESLVDDLVESSLEGRTASGATVAVVADGEVALTKGYGVADRDEETAVDATTPFRVGSVSKPVVATALMARIQRGDIDPQAPVSDYLDAGLDDTVGPATLADLVTHRAGYEMSNEGLWITDADALRPLPDALRTWSHARVRPPGEAPAYSNYGYAVAGGVLGVVADAPFHEAVAADLLDPVGMTASSFRQPLPDSLAEAHATGYGPGAAYADGEFPYVGLAPAGALSTTADDMARFMQLHLNDGVVDGERVLAPETVAACQRQWATAHERLPGIAFGFVESDYGGVRTLRHSGGTPAFYSDLLVVPERGLGLFVAYNGADGGTAARDVLEGFRSELLPDPDSGSNPDRNSGDEGTRSPDGQPARAGDLGGTYRSLRHSSHWHDRVTTTLQADTVEVTVADDGALVTTGGSVTRRWVEIEPLVFERVDGSERLAFDTGADGEAIEYLHRGANPTTAYGRVEGVDRLSLHAALTVLSLVGLLSAVFGWPTATAIGWFRSGDDADAAADTRRWTDRPATLARVVAAGAAVAVLAFPVAALIHLAATPFAVLSAPPPTFVALFALPILGLVGTLAALGFAVRAWTAGYWGRFGRLHYTLVAGSLAVACWLLWFWNLLVPPL
ncbi:penicillin-binding protein, beta-lactamase class c [Halosimplex carlsbadense 2-9-1]|uniref:Penicillin-binding protein, beta-lactamase class c n=1 Tax=Halosimplex carlsbadense 2-9-1 TaxID=797114 RepID=M0D459_9EURY|nr:serine hydrolase domain-containing protein [Halosimplex carlsbadense]ELZ30230.1 penicillin-binding protein, beta-lactamase class c [Halosimplex carlsbadense 2-9-1]